MHTVVNTKHLHSLSSFLIFFLYLCFIIVAGKLQKSLYYMYWEERVQLRTLLYSTIDGGQCSASHPGRFTPGESAPF